MKVAVIMVMLAISSADRQVSTFEKLIQKNRNQTISMLRERLSVIESDIVDIDYVISETNSYIQLRELNETLFQDKLSIEKVLEQLEN